MSDAGVIGYEPRNTGRPVRTPAATRPYDSARFPVMLRYLPAGIGAIVGAVGNRMMGKRIVENARAAFGAAPARWTTTLRVLPAVGDNTGN